MSREELMIRFLDEIFLFSMNFIITSQMWQK